MDLKSLVEKSNIEVHQVVKFDDYLPLDLSKNNTLLSDIDLNSETDFTDFVFNQINKAGKQVGIGGYAEERSLYSRSDLFEGEEARTIHLGIDIWAIAGTQVFAPLDGKVHSFANRKIHGDYGPVIILEHEFDNVSFHTLFGHLSSSSLEGLQVGKEFVAGEVLGSMGEYNENFHWPPHLHFQVIQDMQGAKGDYPGVAIASQGTYSLNNCPDPSILIFR